LSEVVIINDLTNFEVLVTSNMFRPPLLFISKVFSGNLYDSYIMVCPAK
jgi:hypothetical protein